MTINSLLNDKEPPVKVEAAIALQMMLSSKGDLAKKYLEPQIREITLELLNIILMTEKHQLTTVMQKIISIYSRQLLPLAEIICDNLTEKFAQVQCLTLPPAPPKNSKNNFINKSDPTHVKLLPASLKAITSRWC